jgi:uncharacterized protein YoxC
MVIHISAVRAFIIAMSIVLLMIFFTRRILLIGDALDEIIKAVRLRDKK